MDVLAVIKRLSAVKTILNLSPLVRHYKVATASSFQPYKEKRSGAAPNISSLSPEAELNCRAWLNAKQNTEETDSRVDI